MRMRAVLAFLCVLPASVFAQPYDSPPTLVLDSGGHTSTINQVLFTPDASRIISVSNDKTARIWDAATGECLRVIRLPFPAWSVVSGEVAAAAISPNGELLALGGYPPLSKFGHIYLVSPATGQLLGTLEWQSHIARSEFGGDAVSALAFSPDGQSLVALTSGSALVFNLAVQLSPPKVFRTEGHLAWGCKFSPDGKRLATTDRFNNTGGNNVVVWSLPDGRVERVLKKDGLNWNFDVDWLDDETLVTCFARNTEPDTLQVWNVSGELRTEYPGFKAIQSVTTIPGTRKVLVSSGVEWLIVEPEQKTTGVRFAGHVRGATKGAVSRDGRWAVTAGGKDNELFVWSLADGKVRQHFVGKGRDKVRCGWSPDGQAIAWGDMPNRPAPEDKTQEPLTRSFHWASLEAGPTPDAAFHASMAERNGVSLKLKFGKTGVVTSVQRNGREIAEIDTYSKATILDDRRFVYPDSIYLHIGQLETGKVTRKLATNHSLKFVDFAARPDGRYLLAATADQTLQLWDLNSTEEPGKCLLSFFPAGNEWIAWTPEGYYAASPGGEKLMGWQKYRDPSQLAVFEPAERFRATFYRPEAIRRLLESADLQTALTVVAPDSPKVQVARPAETVVAVAEVFPPKVEIVSPKAGLSLEPGTAKIEAVASSSGRHPVTAMRLLIDGRPAGADALRRVASPKAGDVRQSWSIELTPGRHRAQVLADSEVSQGSSPEIEFEFAAKSQPQKPADNINLPRLYVLSIGVADYENSDLELSFAARDAEAIAGAFRTHGKSLYRSVEAKVIVDKTATQRGIKQGLSWLRKEATQRDVSVLFYSGHGQKDSDGRYYLLPVDVDPEDLLSTAVAGDDVMNALQSTAGRVLAILDACHAGASGGDKRKGLLSDSLIRDLATDDYGIVVMASSMGREFSIESNQHKHGYFTVALLEGLEGKAGQVDGAVYLHKLDAYLTDRVKELTKGRQHPVTAKPTTIRSFPLTKP